MMAEMVAQRCPTVFSGVRALTTCSSLKARKRLPEVKENVVQENPPNRVSFIMEMKRELVPWQEALRCIRAYSLRTIPETVQLSVLVNMALKGGKTKETFKGTLRFPFQFGEERRVLLLADDEVLQANDTADLKGGEDVIDKISRGVYEENFAVVVATNDFYPRMRHLQLNLKAKMPNPRTGTVVGEDMVDEAIAAIKSVKTIRVSKGGCINCSVGKLDFSEYSLEANMKHLLQVILEHKGLLSPDFFLKRLTMSTSFGPGYDVFVSDLV